MAPNKSRTEQLANKIQGMTATIWGPEQKREICDMLRMYRQEAVFEAVMKLRTLAKRSGDSDLSSEIFPDNK